MERFYDGQKVVCISEDFPLICCTDKNINRLKHSDFHPKKGETLTINEMLGNFLRFDKYDNDSHNWWHCSRFKPLDEIVITANQKETVSLNFLESEEYKSKKLYDSRRQA